MTSRAEILSQSKRLSEPKYQGCVEAHVPANAEVLAVADADLEFFDPMKSGMKMERDLVFVLTSQTLFGMRPRGMMGAKKPLELDLSAVEGCAVTRQGNTSIKFKDDIGYPGIWKLLFHNEAQADLWMNLTHSACAALAQQTSAGSDNYAADLARSHGQDNEPPRAAPESMSADQRSRFTRLHDLLSDLSWFASPDKLGTPFGEGAGLDQAMDRMFRRLDSVEDARDCGRIMATDLLVSARDENVSNDMLRLMGATPDVAKFNVPHDVAEGARQIGEAAVALITQFEGPGSPGSGAMWDLWCQRDDVVGEMLCWHAVARLRMATAGRMDPLERPAWA